jgi:hypothetical protein
MDDGPKITTVIGGLGAVALAAAIGLGIKNSAPNCRMVTYLADGGYQRVSLCGDGGVDGIIVAEDSEGRDWPCACASDGGTCKTNGLDGGEVDAPRGVTLRADHWNGPGCVRKPCVEVAGGPTSMPKECR